MAQRLLILALGCLIAAIICGEELFSPLWFDSPDDGMIRYPYLIEQFYTLFSKGILYPRWIYGLNGGYGYPTFMIYPPGYWFFSLPFMALSDDPVVAAKALRFTVIVIAFCSAVRLARLFGNNRTIAIVLSIFMALDWKQVLYHYSGAVAFIFILWGFIFFYELPNKLKTGHATATFIGFILCSAAAVYAHPFSATFYGIVIIYSSLGYLLNSNTSTAIRRQFILHILIAGITIVTLTSPYWYTTYTFSDKVHLEYSNTTDVSPLWTFIHRGQGKWGFWYLYFIPECPVFNMTSSLLTLYGFWMLRARREFLLLAIPYLLALFLLTEFSLPIWEQVHCLKFLQRPYRLFLLLNLISTVMVYRLFAEKTAHWRASLPLWGGLVIVGIVWNLFTYVLYPRLSPPFLRSLPHVSYAEHKHNMDVNGFATYQGQNEYLPVTASLENLPNRLKEHLPSIQSVNSIDAVVDTGFPIKARLQTTSAFDGKAIIRINQFYLPGWKVVLDGTELSLSDRLSLDPHGLINVEINQAGSHELIAYYDGPPGWEHRNALILAMLAGLGYAYHRLQKRTSYNQV